MGGYIHTMHKIRFWGGIGEDLARAVRKYTVGEGFHLAILVVSWESALLVYGIQGRRG